MNDETARPTAAADPRLTRWSLDGPCTDGERLRDHLRAVHDQAAGFTQACATACRDDQGRNSYEWLCGACAPQAGEAVLDLACGSGVLLDLCRDRYPRGVDLYGIDMSAAELVLARDRLAGRGVALHEGLAHKIDMAGDGAFQAVLCHWALTLMDPIDPVLAEIGRVLAPGGLFAAIVDGPADIADGYADVSAIIEGHVRQERPHYAELGDPRVRDGRALTALARQAFHGAQVTLETEVFTAQGPPERIALEAAGFYYAAFVLSEAGRARMLDTLAAYFAAQATPGFAMPVSRLLVRMP